LIYTQLPSTSVRLNTCTDACCASDARPLLPGELLRSELCAIENPRVKTIRGRGLLSAVVIEPDAKTTAMDVCIELARLGMLAKPTHGDIIRLAPPLTMDRETVLECAEIFKQATRNVLE
jgi:acetylornithine/succinyldiaminopimelate/putrescine aminotransferase